MKTKIIYISGNEIFDVRDIRAAFEEVRSALNLDKTTVLFGVPVDAEDAGFATKTEKIETISETIPTIETIENVSESETIEAPVENIVEPIATETPTESVDEQPIKKRGRPRKENIVEKTDDVVENTNISETTGDEKIVPILSVLSNDETPREPIDEQIVDDTSDVEIIPEISDDIIEKTTTEITANIEISDDEGADLEKLLSAMTPLQEDIPEKPIHDEIVEKTSDDYDADISIDATLEQLATEFAENQDKIVSENKSTTRSKIGKLRNILPFKQSKHKDQGLGDLFGWAGIAANDEDFSVPGFFTSAASKK